MTTLIIPCKKYTFHYITNHFGTPANFSECKILRKFILLLLKGKRKVPFTSMKIAKYDHYITIMVNDFDYEHSRTCLDRQSILFLNIIMEEYVKDKIRTAVNTLIFEGYKRETAMKLIQDKFRLTEDILKLDTIKKDLQRNSKDLD